jgi:hypothetical protein
MFNDTTINKDFASWTISVPRLRRWPRQRSIRSQIKFTIQNLSDSVLHIQVRLRSPTRMLIFRSTTERKIRRNRIKETSEAFEEIIEKDINPHDETTFLFPFHYRPHLAPMRMPNIRLEYLINGFDEQRRRVLTSGAQGLILPIETGK